jgi:iron complex outermembrane recepter protein
MKNVMARSSWLVGAAIFLSVANPAIGRTAPTSMWAENGTGNQRAIPERPATGRVVGVLKDQSGAVLAGARVELRNLESSVTSSSASDARGRYVFEGVPAGRYLVAAMSPGFEPAIRDEVAVDAGPDVVLDFVLSVARQEASVVVTAPSTTSPLVVETDPRAPRQPIPAHDGADYLKTIPGFSVVRKGGTDGDPVLRGMAGSRLGILLDGQQILGGCGGRMDPPTAYVFPASYDRITVLKGPETVLYGAGMSAGAVLFERLLNRADRPGVTLSSALTAASFGRHDEMADVRVSVPTFYLQAGGTRSHTDDYADGNGALIHSAYTRWSGQAAFGWTPDTSTRLELSTVQSNGQAAYADRAMDGVSFARNNVAIKLDRRFTSSFLQRIEVQSYYNYIDHVMDNFTLRRPGTSFAVNNPDRTTIGGRGAATLAVKTSTSVVVGTDVQRNVHTLRTAMGMTSAAQADAAYRSAPRAEDLRFLQVGLFAEVTHALTRNSRLAAGARSDWHQAMDSRLCIGTTMCPATSPLRNDTRGATDRRTLPSGFGRYEYDVNRNGLSGRFSIGVGHVERSPDYWERVKQSPVTLKSAFLSTRPEKTTQLDAGMVWSGGAWSGSVSAFAGTIHDYILIRWLPAPTLTRNVDATTRGTEANVAYHINRHLTADATLAYVRGDNTTDGKPLAQQPPTEGRVGLTYDNRTWSLAALARVVASQTRVDVGSGNIVSNGMDLGPTGGFSVFSINGGYRLKRAVLVAVGVDNLLNRAYAEHISQGGAAVPGFVQTTRINEPGRTVWLKVNFNVR